MFIVTYVYLYLSYLIIFCIIDRNVFLLQNNVINNISYIANSTSGYICAPFFLAEEELHGNGCS